MFGLIKAVWQARPVLLSRIKSERGAAGVEYGILVAAIAAVIVAVVFAIGLAVNAAFETVNTELGGGGGEEPPE